MHRRWPWLLAAVLPLMGCPFFNFTTPVLQFTSADLSNNAGIFGAPAGDAAAEDGGDTISVPRDVVEPDVIRREGDILYVLNQFRGLIIVDLTSHELIAQVPTYGFPRDLYLQGDRAYVLVGQATDIVPLAETLDGPADSEAIQFSIASRLFVVDILQPENAAIVSTFDLEGDLIDSRLVGDILYAVTAQFEWFIDTPDASGGGDATTPVATEVRKKQTSASTITSINIADTNNIFKADELEVPGFGTVIHVTSSQIFLAVPRYDLGTTEITYIDIADPLGSMSVGDTISVSGIVADKFKLDVWNDVLRVVSFDFNDGRRVIISTIDVTDPNAMAILASTVLERATGETLFATRFDGPRAYIVTFLTVDPLFVVDLSDPENPQVVGELEVPGWSTHIEARGDRLFALGVDNTGGKRRVSVSQFNVADPANPTLVDRVAFGDEWTWTSAFSDVKAFNVLDDIIIVPFSGWTSDFGGFQRLQFISHTPEALQTRGFVDLDGTVLRSFQYNTLFYGVTTEEVVAIDGTDLDNLEVVDRLVLAEFAADFLEVSSTLGVEVITRFDDATTLLRSTGTDLLESTELVIDVGGLINAFVHNDAVVLVGQVWDESPRYTVALVSVSATGVLELTFVLDINVEPFPFYGFFPPGPFLEGDVAFKSIVEIAPIFAFSQNIAFVLGDILAIRTGAATFDEVLGSGEAFQGIAWVNLESGLWTSTTGLAFDRILTLDAAGNNLYLGTKDNAGADDLGQPVCAHYIREISPAGPTLGPRVNVPGAFLQYDPPSDILLLRDTQWDPDSYTLTTIESVRWDGGDTVALIDALELPQGTGQILARGAKIFLDGYDIDGYTLTAVDVSPQGNLAFGGAVTVTDQFGWLLDAHASSAFVSVGSSAIAHYRFDGAGELVDVIRVMGTPHTMRFGESTAYAISGYFGIVPIPF